MESILCNSLRIEYEYEVDDEPKPIRLFDGRTTENIEYGMKILNNDGAVYEINGVHWQTSLDDSTLRFEEN